MTFLQIPRNKRTRVMSRRLAEAIKPFLEATWCTAFEIQEEGNVCCLVSKSCFPEREVWDYVDGFLKEAHQLRAESDNNFQLLDGCNQVKSNWMCPNGHKFEINTTIGKGFDIIGNEYIITCPVCYCQSRSKLA